MMRSMCSYQLPIAAAVIAAVAAVAAVAVGLQPLQPYCSCLYQPPDPPLPYGLLLQLLQPSYLLPLLRLLRVSHLLRLLVVARRRILNRSPTQDAKAANGAPNRPVTAPASAVAAIGYCGPKTLLRLKNTIAASTALSAMAHDSLLRRMTVLRRHARSPTSGAIGHGGG